MAEIDVFISPQAQKQVDDYKKDVLEIASHYDKIISSSKKLDSQKKNEISTDTQLIKQKRELEKLEQDKLRTDAIVLRNEVALTKAVENETKAIAKKNNAMKANKSAYKQLSADLTNARNKSKDLAVTHGIMSKAFLKSAKDVALLDKRLKQIDARLGQHQRNVGNYGRAWGGVSKLMGALGFTGVLFTAVSAIKNGINGIREFGKQNAILAGVLGKTRKQITVLTKDAKRLGRDTAKTAEEVNGLQIAYARLGFTQSEILDLTEDTINGSIALNAELADTADLTGAVIKSFDDLKTTDADLVLDQLTLSTQRSALNFSKLQTAIPITAGAAAAAKVPFSTMIAQLGQAADRGIDASTSATSLRNIYLELAKKGITLEQALNKINTSQDKLSAANDLFGKRAAVTALALADTIDKTKGLDKALQDAGGTAKRVAEEQLATLDGRLTLLSSAYDGFVKSLDKGETALSQFVQTGITEMTKFFNFLSRSDGEFDEGLFTKDMAANSEANLKRFKETYEREAAAINSKFTSDQLITAATATNFWRKTAAVFRDEDFVGAGGEKGIIQVNKKINKAKEASSDLITINKKLAIINDILAGSYDEVNENTDENTSSTNENRVAKSNLLEIESITRDLKVEWHEREAEIEDKILHNAEESAMKRAEIDRELVLNRQETEAENLRNQLFFDQIRRESGINTSLNISQAAANLAGEQTAVGKIAAANQAAISGFLGAQKAFTETPGPIFVKAAAAAAAGSFAIRNIGRIISTKTDVPTVKLDFDPNQNIPLFAEGTDSTPHGNWVAGEAGREIEITKSGRVSMIDKPTLFSNRVGSTILSNPVTEKIIEHSGKSSVSNINMDEVVKAIENNAPIMGINKFGIITIAKKNKALTKHVNDNYRS